jgi:hypothetical protein
MLGKVRLILRGGEEDGNAVVDGKHSGAVLTGERGFEGWRDAGAGALLGGGPAERLMGVRTAELGEESFDPGGVRCGGHEWTFARGGGRVKGEGVPPPGEGSARSDGMLLRIGVPHGREWFRNGTESAQGVRPEKRRQKGWRA